MKGEPEGEKQFLEMREASFRVNFIKLPLRVMVWLVLFLGGMGNSFAAEMENSAPVRNITGEYPGVPQSSLYAVTITEGNDRRSLAVFQSACPEYRAGYMNMNPKDQYPFELFKGRTIDWVNFSFAKPVTIQVRILDTNKISLADTVKIFPTRYGMKPMVQGNTISFTMTQPGQCSVEIGADGYKHGLLIFANPPETDKPDPVTGNYYVLTNATPAEIGTVPDSYSGIYFKRGVHDIGVYHVPAHIQNIYFEAGSWVYGALAIEGHSGVKIFGRGVLSEATLNYREAHAIEATHQSDQVDLEGIVVADKKFFAVRLLGKNNTVKWVKIVGGWTYNSDGIAAFAGSTVAHCFIWANDDSLKPYQDNLMISDCVVWQLNNGAVIQLGWGNAKATNVVISNVDILHAEWNNNAANRGVVSCIGDKFAKGGMTSRQQDFLIENLVTETPVPFLFNLRPNPASSDEIHGMVLKNWNIKMDMDSGYPNFIVGSDPTHPFEGFVFDNFTLNNVKLTETNWIGAGRFVTTNLVMPVFKH